jgi:hypothetical protein
VNALDVKMDSYLMHQSIPIIPMRLPYLAQYVQVAILLKMVFANHAPSIATLALRMIVITDAHHAILHSSSTTKPELA